MVSVVCAIVSYVFIATEKLVCRLGASLEIRAECLLHSQYLNLCVWAYFHPSAPYSIWRLFPTKVQHIARILLCKNQTQTRLFQLVFHCMAMMWWWCDSWSQNRWLQGMRAARHCAILKAPVTAGAFICRWCGDCSLARACQSPTFASALTPHFFSACPEATFKWLTPLCLIFSGSVSGEKQTHLRRSGKFMQSIRRNKTDWCFVAQGGLGWAVSRAVTRCAAPLLYEVLFCTYKVLNMEAVWKQRSRRLD